MELKKFFSFFPAPIGGQAGKIQRQISEESQIFTCRKADLKYIKTGMFWFEDDTFADKLIPGKQVKAIVLRVLGKTVYGWLPQEVPLVYDKKRDYREYAEQVLEDSDTLKIVKRPPTLSELLFSFNRYAQLFSGCSAAEMPLLSGLYWSWDWDRPYFRYDPKKGEKFLIHKACSAKLRWIIEARVKSKWLLF